MISFRPLMNSDRFLQCESIVYARATFAGSRVFQPSSARRTFCIALSRVNGGKGGRAGVVAVPMISSPGIDSFGILINSCARAAISLAAMSRERWPPSTMSTCTESTVFRRSWLIPTICPTILDAFGFQPSSHTFAPMGVRSCQQEINDSQHHHHESVDKEPAISQHENVTENYGSHPDNNQSPCQSGCLRNQEQNRHRCLEGS